MEHAHARTYAADGSSFPFLQKTLPSQIAASVYTARGIRVLRTRVGFNPPPSPQFFSFSPYRQTMLLNLMSASAYAGMGHNVITPFFTIPPPLPFTGRRRCST